MPALTRAMLPDERCRIIDNVACRIAADYDLDLDIPAGHTQAVWRIGREGQGPCVELYVIVVGTEVAAEYVPMVVETHTCPRPGHDWRMLRLPLSGLHPVTLHIALVDYLGDPPL